MTSSFIALLTCIVNQIGLAYLPASSFALSSERGEAQRGRVHHEGYDAREVLEEVAVEASLHEPLDGSEPRRRIE